MDVCNDHNIAYTGHNCPACELYAEVSDLEDQLKDKDTEIRDLADEITALRRKLK